MNTNTADLSLDHRTVAVRTLPLTLFLIAVVIVPHAIFYRENAILELIKALRWWSAPSIVAGIVVHELLHGVTMWAMAGLRWSELTFGVHWRTLMAYAHPTRPIPAGAYVVGAAMPGLVLGLVPAIVGLAIGSGAWSGWGALFLAAAAGDVLIIHSVRHVPARALVRDHPSRVGCELVTSGS